MELALVTCEALSEDELADFLAAGGQISSGWGRECRAPEAPGTRLQLRSLTRALAFNDVTSRVRGPRRDLDV